MCCPKRNDITASHLGRGYHGLKNHDWTCVPMCSWCHWEYEYHRELVSQRMGRDISLSEAEAYFQRYLKESGEVDDRTEAQKKAI